MQMGPMAVDSARPEFHAHPHAGLHASSTGGGDLPRSVGEAWRAAGLGPRFCRQHNSVSCELNEQILAGGTAELCALIESNADDFECVNVVTAFRKLLTTERAGAPNGAAESVLQMLEKAALRRMPDFCARDASTILHVIAKAGYRPQNPQLMTELDNKVGEVMRAGNAKELAITLWAYATMGREPGERVMGKQEHTSEHESP